MSGKTSPHTCCLQETHIRMKDAYRLKVKEKIFHANENEKKSGVAIDFKPKTTVRDKEGLHNDKGNNPTEGYTTCRDFCTQHRST